MDKVMVVKVAHLALIIAGLMREGVEFDVQATNGDDYKIILKGF